MCSVLHLVGREVNSACLSARVGQALAESLKTNGSLADLLLQNNNIGDRGAEAPAAECMLVGAGG